jgi:site-specific DNA-methyltransferase (adenine-specific)
VEKMDNIDTTQTTQNLLKLFGYVKVVITNYIQGNIEYDQKRYIYTPKASKKDRDEGCHDLEDTVNACSNQAIAELKRGNDTFSDEVNSTFNKVYKGKNTHPTVKPTSLMQYLVRLVTPNNGTVLDPFNGSGSTGKAVMYENHERNKNYKYIGIELTEEYLPISKARIEYVCNLEPEVNPQMSIFDLEVDNE